MEIYNCHTHVFTSGSVPDKFLPGVLRPVSGLLKRDGLAGGLNFVFKKLGWSGWAGLVQRYNALLNIGSLPSQEAVLQHLQGFYPANTHFIVLSMDLEFLGAGKVAQPFEEQLAELARLKRKPQYRHLLHPFIFVHPERPGIFDLVRKYLEEEDFAGIKIYPPVGYYPFDERLYTIYAYAQQYQIPIMTHCTRGGVYYKGKITPEMQQHPKTGERLRKSKSSEFTEYYTDPDNYRYVLADFPELKICFGHFGGGREWEKYLTVSWNSRRIEADKSWYSKIRDLMKDYPNVYADISYTLCDDRFFNLLKVTLQDPLIRKRVLYGSDYYMLEQELTEREFSINLRAFLGDADYRQIAQANPVNYLLKEPKPGQPADDQLLVREED